MAGTSGGGTGATGTGGSGTGGSGEGGSGTGGSGEGGSGTGGSGEGGSGTGGTDRGRDRGERYGNGRERDGRYEGEREGRYENGGNGGGGEVRWRGNVDDVAEIRIQGGRVSTRTVSGREVSGVQTERSGQALPLGAVGVRVDERAGRGRVAVVQQPSAQNGYIAVVRIEDRDRGAAWYDVDVRW